MGQQKMDGSKVAVLLQAGTGAPAAIAYSTSCSVSISAKTVDVSNKDSVNPDFPDMEVTGHEWNVDNESFIADTATLALILEKQVSKQFVPVTVRQGASGVSFAGQALLTSVKVTADNGDKAKLSISLKGIGNLQKINPAAVAANEE